MSTTSIPRRNTISPASHTYPKPLPAWPLFLLLAGVPLWWALGAAAFIPMLLAAVMAGLMATRHATVIVPGFLPWLVFLAWVAAACVNLGDGISVFAYGQRAGNLLAVGIFMLYVINARQKLPASRIVHGLLAVWVTIVVLGIAAIYVPEYRLTTIVGQVLPASLTQNSLVHDLVFPRLAEVQQPYGAPEPFNRPSAPFPYANSWGVMFAVLTPVVIAAIAMTRNPWAKVALVAGLGVSVWPALATSNRGMLLGLTAAIVYVIIRLFFRGHLAGAAAGLTAVIVSGGALVASGRLQEILDRQLYSDSTGGRMSLYKETWKATLERPLLGYGGPRMEESIGVSMGTQGYLWMLMFSYGLVGLGLFLYFLVSAVVRTWRTTSVSTLWLHSVPIAAMVMIPFYGFDVLQLTAVLVVLALLLRKRYLEEEV